MAKVRTCLWFASDAEQAVHRYVELIPESRIERVQRSPGPWPGGKAGDALVIDFTLGEQAFQALNGGTRVDYGTAASISVACADQAEVDRLWAALTADGGAAIQCGWLRDRWGVPWQIVPTALPSSTSQPSSARRRGRRRQSYRSARASRPCLSARRAALPSHASRF